LKKGFWPTSFSKLAIHYQWRRGYSSGFCGFCVVVVVMNQVGDVNVFHLLHLNRKDSVIISSAENSSDEADDNYDYEDDEIVFVGPNDEDWCYDPDSDYFFDELLKLKNDTTDMCITQGHFLLKKVFLNTRTFLQCSHMRQSCYRTWEHDLKLHFSKGGQKSTAFSTLLLISPSTILLFVSQFSYSRS